MITWLEQTISPYQEKEILHLEAMELGCWLHTYHVISFSTLLEVPPLKVDEIHIQQKITF